MWKHALWIGLFAAGLELCAASVCTSNTKLETEDGSVRVSPVKPGDWSSAQLETVITTGPSGKAQIMKAPQVTEAKNSVSLLYRTPEFNWKITFSPRGKMILAESELTNLTDRELWLEPEFRLKPDRSEILAVFWNGFGNTEKTAGKLLERRGIKGVVEKHVGASTMPFPVSAAGGKNSSLFTGSVPFDPVSYTAGSLDPAKQQLTYSLRLVAAPRETIRFRQTIGCADTAYGLSEAIIQQYYDAFPECWAVVMGQENPYVWGCHGGYENWWKMPEAENSRRLGITLEWTYCPFRRAGDMWMREELWNYTPKNPFRADKAEFGKKLDMGKITRAEYIQWRQDSFRKMARPFGLMFYNTVAGTWCEYNLAQQKYPDAITHDKSVMYILNNWSTHHDQEIRVFPMGTSFAKVFEEDMVLLAKDLDLPGFALDCAYGGAYYRGPAVEKPLPGRAWDEEGKFIDQSVAINHEVDFIHGINTAPDRKLTAFINGYLKGDYVMVESPFFNLGKFNRWMPLLRWYIGPRPGCVHGHGYMFKELVPDWRDKSPADFQEIMSKLSDYVIMNQFKYGLTETQLTQRGNPQQLYVFPELIDLMRAGWQAEIPMIPEEGMRIPYRARYGKGVGTFFFLGNSGGTDVSGKVRFDNAALSDEPMTFLFNRKMRDRAVTLNRIEKNFSEVDAILPSRVPVIYESVAALRGTADPQQWKVSSEKALNSQRYLLDYVSGGKFVSEIVLRTIRGFRVDKVTLDGKTVAVQGNRTSPVNFVPGAKVEVVYASTDFHLPAEKITNFPFTNSKKEVSFTVRVPRDGAEKALAERFNEYFDFCRRNKVIAASSPSVKIETVETLNPSAGTVTLLVGKDRLPGAAAIPDGVSMGRDGGLIVKASDPAQARRILDGLFGVMDRRYEYLYPFQWVMGLSGEMLTHFGMFGKTLPYRKYFEGAAQ